MATIAITNFNGSLTRVLNGELNSGKAKFNTSWGYDPFSKPGNLTWLEAPVDLDPTNATIGRTVVCARPRLEGGQQGYVYAVGTNYGNDAKLYKIQPNSLGNPNLDTASVLCTVGNGSYFYGGSMEFYGPDGNGSVLSVSNDSNLLTINTDGSGETVKTALVANVYHPTAVFLGKLYVGDGQNLRCVDGTGTVTSSILSPGLPPGVYIRDLDVSPDGNYLTIAASQIPSERQDYSYDRVSAATGSGYLYKWNGTDQGVTSYNTFPSHAVTASKTFIANQYLFSNDSFGANLIGGNQKVRTLTNNRSVIPNAVATNGNFLTWTSTESTDGTLKGSMYYYGQLDEENPSGLWRVFRNNASVAGAFVYTCPVNVMAENKFMTLNTSQTSVATYGLGKHYVSEHQIGQANASVIGKLYRFNITPTGTGTPNQGVYETQTQLFSKKQSIKQIRVYTEPTATGNGFQIDVITNDGSSVYNSTYSYQAGTDITKLQGSLERINFNPSINDLFGFAIKITNTGTTNMTIKKIEVDYEDGGK